MVIKSVGLLSAANVVHTVRMANALAERGIKVYLLSLHDHEHDAGYLHPDVSFYKLPFGAPSGYVLSAVFLRCLLHKLRPDVLNAHFATGYGLLARLGCPKWLPSLLSVWGTDVYEFPLHSPIKKWILKGNLKAAKAIGSTSHAMADQVRKTYPHPCIFITPFGVDTDKFKPILPSQLDEAIVVGTVKTLKHRYGIDRLIRAFAMAYQQVPAEIAERMQLRIVGGGPDQEQLKHLSAELGVETEFVGQIPHYQVPNMLNTFDIYVALSRYESFGVAIIEASACGLPVVVSDADGPAEVTEHGKTGYICSNEQLAAEAIASLAQDRSLRQSVGKSGRESVVNNYAYHSCIEKMLSALHKTKMEVSS